jgi:hypothetical protein
MEDQLKNNVDKCFLAVLVFVASFQATWTVLESFKYAPNPPTLNYEKSRNIPTKNGPVLI